MSTDKETVWLRAEEMAELFDRDRSVIQRDIRNIIKENELEKESTCAKFAQVVERQIIALTNCITRSKYSYKIKIT